MPEKTLTPIIYDIIWNKIHIMIQYYTLKDMKNDIG